MEGEGRGAPSALHTACYTVAARMSFPSRVVRLVQWRWMPAVAITTSALAFVGLSVALIPNDLAGFTPERSSNGDEPREPSRPRLAARAVEGSPSTVPPPSPEAAVPMPEPVTPSPEPAGDAPVH